MKDVVLWIITNGENQVACFLEILLILLCVHGVFKAKFKFTIVNALIILLDLIVMALIHMELVGQFATGIIYLLLFVYCIWKFKRKFWETVGFFILSVVLIALIEIISSLVALPVATLFDNSATLMIIVNLIGVVLAISIIKFPDIRKRKFGISFDREKWGTLIVISGLCMLVILIDYRLRGEVDQIYYFLFLVASVVTCVTTIKTQEARNELEKKQLELEMQEIYGDAYKNLISEVRRRQHDFVNQLGAIYSMHLTANSLEELVEEQQKYGNVLLEKSRYDKILTGCNNSILAGYLYYKCVAYEESNVQVDYQVHVDTAYCCLSLHEVIEILGILLTNAYENYSTDIEEKRIGLIVQENANNLMIEVSNLAKELTTKEIDRMFHEGYSSKGKNRGIGLARVKQLVSNAEADLVVENQTKDNKNWIKFRVMIPKGEGE